MSENRPARQQKSAAKKTLIIGVGVVVVAVVAAVVYLAVRLGQVALYPDQKSRAGFGSVRPLKAYDVRGPENMMSGVNFGLALQAPQIGTWGVVLQESDFTAAQRAGFHYIRVQVQFLPHLRKRGGSYSLDPRLLARLDWVIRNILNRHMIAVIDFFNLVGNQQFTFTSPAARKRNEKEFLAVWRILAKRHHRKVILGEFGASVFSDLASQDRWTEFVRHEAEAHGMVWIFWDFFSQDKLGSLYDPATGIWRGTIVKSLLPHATFRLRRNAHN